MVTPSINSKSIPKGSADTSVNTDDVFSMKNVPADQVKKMQAYAKRYAKRHPGMSLKQVMKNTAKKFNIQLIDEQGNSITNPR